MATPLPHDDLQHVLVQCEPLWSELAGSRLFITGGTGFFGKWLLECLLHANAARQLNLEILALSRDPDAFLRQMPHLRANPALHWLQGDIRDFSFPAGPFSHIIHAATTASATLNITQPLEMFDTIVAGTRRVLDCAVATGSRNLLLTSSGAVYGEQPAEVSHLSETAVHAPTPCDPQSAYAEGKRAAELLCTLYAQAHGLTPRIARCFAFIGPHLPLDSHFAAGNFLRDALAGKTIIVRGDGRPLRSYLHAADLVVWLLTILLRGRPNTPYNVGSDESLSIAALARQIAQAVLPPVGVNICNPVGHTPPHRYVPSTKRAQLELGLHPQITLPAAIASTLAWHSAQRA